MATEYFNDAWRIPNNKNQSLVSNYSMEFDGTGGSITTGFSPPTGANNRTISVWFKTGVNAFENICGYGTFAAQQGFDIVTYQSPANTVGVHCVNTQVLAGGVYVPNQWNNYVVTYDGTILRGYVNGVPVNTTIITLNTGTLNNFLIGAGAYSTTNGFVGSIDQVSIFDYELSSSQVSTLYGGGTAITNPMALSPKPIAYYQLGDQSVDNGANYLVPNNSLQDYVFDFDGSSQNINIDNEITLSNNKSISFWLNFDTIPTQTGAGPVPLSSSTNLYYPMIAITSGNMRFYITGSNGFTSVVTNTAVIANTWYHIVITGDGTNAYWYINGGIDSGGFTSDRTGVSIKSIGSRLNGSSRSLYVDGQMSNVAIWDSTTLTSAQVTTIYNNGSPNDISSLNPTHWWKLNAQDTFDGTNWTIKDYAGSNDGTSNDMTSANLVQSNLQQTSGYSPYALSLDANDANYFTLNNGGGNGLLNAATSLTISAWINIAATSTYQNIFTRFFGGVMFRVLGTNGNLQLYLTREDNTYLLIQALNAVSFNEWQHLAATWDGSTVKLYVNNVEVIDASFSDTLKNDTSNNSDLIGNRVGTTQYFNGKISNVAIWKNTVINVTTLYNQGVPADLTSLNPSGWWQMGSNSSFDANTSKWTCLNEGTTRTSAVPSNATTFAGNMTNDDIVNGVGYSANGLGTSSIEIVGDAPYSIANGISENMDVLDRTTDVPS